MRYYEITITDPTTGKLVQKYESHPNGILNPAALNIEFDAFVATMGAPASHTAARLTIWGDTLLHLSQAFQLGPRFVKGVLQQGMTIALYGGMKAGLPLAKPAQSGLLLLGSIFQSFGNWQGVDMTLDLLFYASTGNIGAPLNIVFNWKAGTPMATAIQATLSTAFPTYKLSVNISKNLVLSRDMVGYYQSLQQFAQKIQNLSKDIIGTDTYSGVEIFVKQTSISVYDGTSTTAPKPIAFNDLIGQITWIGVNKVTIKCVLRADIYLGDYVTLPPGQFVTTAQSYASYKQGSIFQGTYRIASVHHFGNFRQPTGDSWATVLEAVQVTT